MCLYTDYISACCIIYAGMLEKHDVTKVIIDIFVEGAMR